MADKVMKTVGGEKFPASDFLVVEDPSKPSTWRLQVRKHGKPDHVHMGGAHAALLSPGGHRGRKYEGPDKAKAIAKLKALYKAEEMPWPGAAKESDTLRIPNLIESARLLEAVEGSEGLEWEIECIAAGRSENRKDYTPDVLRAALPLFDGLTSYANHPSKQEMRDGLERDITKMAGWVTNARWDPSGGKNNMGAVVGIYHALKAGPIAALLQEAWERQKPDLVQFSILGEGKQRVTKDTSGQLYYHVEAIDDLFSLDAVAKGAAGGRVRSLIASEMKEVEELKVIEELTREELVELRPDLFEVMEVIEETPIIEEVTPIVEAEEVKVKVEPEVEEVIEPTEPAPLKEVEEMTGEVKALREEMEKIIAVNRRHFLDKHIGKAELPVQVKAQARKRYESAAFVESDVIADIAENVKMWSEVLRDQPKVSIVQTGPAEVDKFLDAMEGMLAGKDINDVPRFHGVREAYCTVTRKPFTISNRELVDSVMRESIDYASWQTADLREASLREAISWTSVLGVSMYRRLIAEYKVPIYDEWRLIVSEIGELKDMKQQLRERTGYYGTLPSVAKGGTYQPLSSPGEEEANFTPGKYGGLESWDWEDALNDDLGALKKIPKKLALAAKVTLYQYIFNFLRDGPTTTVTYDGVNLFIAGHANVGTDALGTAGLTTADISMRNQAALSSAATYLAIRPKYLVIPHDLKTTAAILMNSQYYVPATIDPLGVGIAPTAANPHKDAYATIIVDYWTTVNRWFLVADPNLVPTIEVGFLDGKEEPELFSLAENTGSAFSADKVIWKIRHVYGAGVLDHRGLYSSIG